MATCTMPWQLVSPQILVSVVVLQSTVSAAGQTPSAQLAAWVSTPAVQLAARHSTVG
jgi:hypothetical protein